MFSFVSTRIVFVTSLLLAGAFGCVPEVPTAGPANGLQVQWPAERIWVGATNVEGIVVTAVDADGHRARSADGRLRIEGLTLTSTAVSLVDGQVRLPPATIDAPQITVALGAIEGRHAVPTLSGPLSLLPALLAIALALATRQVLLSLFGGVLLGAGLLHRSATSAFASALDTVVLEAADTDHAKTIIFTLLIGGMVGLITANGGTMGVVDAVARRARSVRSGSLATWGLGLLVFFDDYASSLIIGTTMRPMTDRLRISREKLSYMVDSTAAPISSLALISTWIGYEVSVLGDALAASGIDRDPYEVFLRGLSSRFYPIFALAFVGLVAILGRDFGPMLAAERRARRGDGVIAPGAEPLLNADMLEDSDRMKDCVPRAWLAVLPLAALIGTVVGVLLSTGFAAAVDDPAAYAQATERGVLGALGFILGNAASFDALVYGAATGGVVALVASLPVGALDLKNGLGAFVRGVQAMLLAVIVLTLAWSIGQVMEDLHAGAYVAQLVGETVPPWSLGTVAFVLAAVMAFATGTSWGTMAILFPIVIPVAAIHAGTAGFETVLLGSSSAVLAGAVFGDHCSPISDTTILSSIASSADLLDHTRTQAPYAIVCAAVAILFGTLPYGLGVPAWMLVVVGLVVLTLTLWLIGRKPDAP